MSKLAKLATTPSKRAGGGIAFVVFVGLFGPGLVGYVISQARAAHWLVAAIGAILGGALGWLWYH